MSAVKPVTLLALLVHRGMLAPAAAQGALRSQDPRAWLIANGHATAEQWQDWLETEAGTRPRLSRYELGELLGEGGQARVFRAQDRVEKRDVALKLLKPELARDPVTRARFIAESKLLLDLRSPHVVRGYRVAREGEAVFCAMELVEGENLQRRLDRDGPLEERLALEVVRQIAEALAHLHERGLVHRDVKPGNVMLERSGRAVLIDLGFAVSRGQGGGSADETTVGTVHYIAPEQARGQQDLDVRADIYSLGATLYHLVTGSLPFAGRTSEEVLAKQVLESLSGERLRQLGLSPQLHWVIEKMMAKEKEIRFQDPRTLAREIATMLARRQDDSAQDDEGPAARARRTRRRWL
ncbi:MAG: serine/threonine protein kinase [Planctomycetes bacterium]|nr:serine/threonine protein kinase [Planctomycetota bacterium]